MSGMRTKTIAAGAGAAGLLGLGLYLAVPAFAADPSPSPSPSSTAHPGHPGKGHPFRQGGAHRGDRDGHGVRGGRGVHGEATVQRKDGFRLATWQRGKITSVSSSGVTVLSVDGASWTWTADDKTRVRKDGEKSDFKSLKNGDQVLVAGERSGDTRTARLIRVPKQR
ncbi:DUF5666 domain-containing protein [Actinomadura chokoriensis]|uniref:DUF5666 domain-containing protein n=1 Tax=Actinomadura chokoriensis TaxID=454156 RepID=A0ABV4R130_9ACTN